MKSRATAVALCAIASIALVACGPRGTTPDEQRRTIRDMRAQALEDLFDERPGLRAKLKGAPGYAVFKHIDTKVFTAGAGTGYGVLVDNRKGRETFMRMAKVHGGFGAGIQDKRLIFVFNKADAMEKFATEGWQLDGGGDVALKSGDSGLASSGGLTIDTGIPPLEVYELTEAGLALSATVAGTKYWTWDHLNGK